MTNRETVRLPNRQERFARALAVLIMGVGILLVGVAFIFRSSSQPNITPLVETASNPETSEPEETVTSSATIPPESVANPVAEAKPTETEKVETPPEQPAITKQTVEAAPKLEDSPASVIAVAAKEPTAESGAARHEEPVVTTEKEPEPETKPAEEISPEPQTLTQADVAAQPETKAEPEQTEKTATAEPPTPESDSSGWIYAGQFVDGQWLERGLVIGNELPANGQHYALNWGANIRATPPGKDTSLSKTIGYLPQGQQIQITEVKKSGNKGHVWLKIKQ